MSSTVPCRRSMPAVSRCQRVARCLTSRKPSVTSACRFKVEACISQTDSAAYVSALAFLAHLRDPRHTVCESQRCTWRTALILPVSSSRCWVPRRHYVVLGHRVRPALTGGSAAITVALPSSSRSLHANPRATESEPAFCLVSRHVKTLNPSRRATNTFRGRSQQAPLDRSLLLGSIIA